MFIAGFAFAIFALMCAGAAALLPMDWQFLRDYQKSRDLYLFSDPDNDPLGAGYHILQSKLRSGSGGLFGKGFCSARKAHLSFLPEKQTDFIFTTLAEEFGLLGGVTLIVLYASNYRIWLSRSRSAAAIALAELLGIGIVNNLFLYVFINIAMVDGLIPVVGVPLPLISYGGTAMLTVMFGFGLLMSVYIDRDVRLNRAGEASARLGRAFWCVSWSAPSIVAT